MKVIKQKLDINLNIKHYFKDIENSEVLLFDIETTGFIADKCILYLIGCTFYEKGSWVYTQYFAEGKSDEPIILKEFFKLCELFKHTISFNGETFDMPFINKKSIEYNISSNPMYKLNSIDLYKLIKKYKGFFKLDNIKQKTIEKFLGIERKDLYTGGELIEQYYEYLSTRSPLLEYNLLLHNADDLFGMLQLVKVMTHINYITSLSAIKKEDVNNISLNNNILYFEITTSAPCPLNQIITCDTYKVVFKRQSQNIKVSISVFVHTLYHFFKDNKNYYYMPDNDEAIHKSIGVYLDASKRISATSTNCYIKKHGMFIETYTSSIDVPIFKISRSSKINYISIDSNNINLDVILPSLKKMLNIQ